MPAPCREAAAPSDPDPLSPQDSFWQTAWKLVSYLGWDAAVLVLAAGLAVAAAALGVFGPIAVGKLWEAFSGPASEGLSGPAAQLLAAYVGRFVLQWLSTSLVGTATENAACRLREALFGSLLELDVAFFDAHASAELAAPLADDVKEVRDALRTAISEGLPAVVRAAGSVVSMLFISTPLAAALACGIPAAAYAGALYAARLRALSRRSQDAQARAAAVSAEGLANIRTVRAFTAEDLQRRQYHDAVAEYSALNKRLGMEITLFNSALSMGMSALAGLVLLYGGQMVQVCGGCQLGGGHARPRDGASSLPLGRLARSRGATWPPSSPRRTSSRALPARSRSSAGASLVSRLPPSASLASSTRRCVHRATFPPPLLLSPLCLPCNEAVLEPARQREVA